VFIILGPGAAVFTVEFFPDFDEALDIRRIIGKCELIIRSGNER